MTAAVRSEGNERRTARTARRDERPALARAGTAHARRAAAHAARGRRAAVGPRLVGLRGRPRRSAAVRPHRPPHPLPALRPRGLRTRAALLRSLTRNARLREDAEACPQAAAAGGTRSSTRRLPSASETTA